MSRIPRGGSVNRPEKIDATNPDNRRNKMTGEVVLQGLKAGVKNLFKYEGHPVSHTRNRAPILRAWQ